MSFAQRRWADGVALSVGLNLVLTLGRWPYQGSGLRKALAEGAGISPPTFCSCTLFFSGGCGGLVCWWARGWLMLPYQGAPIPVASWVFFFWPHHWPIMWELIGAPGILQDALWWLVYFENDSHGKLMRGLPLRGSATSPVQAFPVQWGKRVCDAHLVAPGGSQHTLCQRSVFHRCGASVGIFVASPLGASFSPGGSVHGSWFFGGTGCILALFSAIGFKTAPYLRPPKLVFLKTEKGRKARPPKNHFYRKGSAAPSRKGNKNIDSTRNGRFSSATRRAETR